MKKLGIPIIGVGLCLWAKLYFQSKPLIHPPSSPDLKPLLASYQSHSVEKYSFGFNALIGASIWIQLLQKSNYKPVSNDEVSWEFTQLDAITTLDPNNNRAYDYGAIFISVLRRDKIGGKILLEKWVKKRPDYWRAWYLLGSHYFLELKDYSAAAPLILKASSMAQAPAWISSLGIRLLSESGSYFQALRKSLDLLPQLNSPEGRERLVLRIRSLNYQIQKSYWTEALNSYSRQKGAPPSSISDLQDLVVSSSRELSSLVDSQSPLETMDRKLLAEKFTFRLSQDRKEILPKDLSQIQSLESVGIFIPDQSKEKSTQ